MINGLAGVTSILTQNMGQNSITKDYILSNSKPLDQKANFFGFQPNQDTSLDNSTQLRRKSMEKPFELRKRAHTPQNYSRNVTYFPHSSSRRQTLNNLTPLNLNTQISTPK